METEVIVTETDQMYLDQIEALKAKIDNETVPKEELVKLQAQHKKLLDEYINRRPVETPVVSSRKASDIIKDLSRENNSKLEHVKLSLEYRDAFMKEHGRDPWIGGDITDAQANQVAAGYKHLVQEYGDDPSEFTFRFDSALTDDPSIINALRTKKSK